MALRFLFAAIAVVVLALAAPQIRRSLTRRPPGPMASVATAAVAANPDVPGRVVIDADRNGHYQTRVEVDGRSLDMLVDTGATTVALSHDDGVALGLVGGGDDGFDTPVRTAGGMVKAKRVKLASVAIGDIRLADVDAIVAPAGTLDRDLLGMSALGRLSHVEVHDGRLVLEN